MRRTAAITTFLIASFGQSCSAATPLIDSKGKIVRTSNPISAENGIIANIVGGSKSAAYCEASTESIAGCVVLNVSSSCNGASSAAASSFAKAIVVDYSSVAEEADKALANMFIGKLLLVNDGEDVDDEIAKTTIVSIGNKNDANKIENLFDFCVASLGLSSGTKFNNYYSVIEAEDVDEACEIAAEVQASNASVSTDDLSKTLSKLAISSSSFDVYIGKDLIESNLACDDAYARLYRSARAKALTPWKNRVIQRKLMVDSFGSAAATLIDKTMAAYDVETVNAFSIKSPSARKAATDYRLKVRAKLLSRLEDAIVDLFAAQMSNLETSTLKKFRATLIKQKKAVGTTAEDAAVDYDANAAAIRNAAFEFDTEAGNIEVVSSWLSSSLRSTKYSQDIEDKLATELAAFADSTDAKLKDMVQIQKKAAKRKSPSERSIEAGLGLVAMLRPDGFGNLQGFAGYTLGPHSVIVGVQNDADAPETINQFGGVRPPLLRVQPKLNLDVEL